MRIPIAGDSPKAKRIEFRIPDPSSNPYLCFAAQLMAGLDGIKNRIEPPEPVDKDLYELPPEEHEAIAQVPGSLPEVLDALEADHEFLLQGDVFTEDLIATWIEWKRKNEVDPIRFRPHPHEFEMYFDIDPTGPDLHERGSGPVLGHHGDTKQRRGDRVRLLAPSLLS